MSMYDVRSSLCSTAGVIRLFAGAIGILGIIVACHSPDPASQRSETLTTSLVPPCSFPVNPPSATADLSAFSQFSWQQFIALNWPASGVRGQADCNKSFDSVGPRVWETYKTTDQLFLTGARHPGAWDSGEMLALELKYRAKANDDLQVTESVRQAVGGWLTDQYRNPTYYSISVNRLSYDYVVDNRYYNADIVARAPAVHFPEGALEVKAAWRIMTPNDDTSRFHTIIANVTLYGDDGKPTGVIRPARVGLVGFHIVYKAPGFPQWVWATFEHVDNTPADLHAHASYYNPQCVGMYCKPNQSPLVSGQPFRQPNQLTRVTAIAPEIAAVNKQWQSMLAGTAFANYQLVSPQWPVDPQNPGNPQGTPTPAIVANTVMESYIQLNSSCMDCHSTARVPGDRVKSDYSFIFLFSQSPNTAAAAQGEQQ